MLAQMLNGCQRRLSLITKSSFLGFSVCVCVCVCVCVQTSWIGTWRECIFQIKGSEIMQFLEIVPQKYTLTFFFLVSFSQQCSSRINTF